jgi:hypothetical protein
MKPVIEVNCYEYLKNGFKLASLSLLLLSSMSVSTISQQLDGSDTQKRIVVESFEGNDPDIMLGGQINFRDPKSKWVKYVSDGKLVFENRLDPQNLVRDAIQWVRYPDSKAISTTENAVMSVVVDAKNIGRGGAGIVINVQDRGAYWVFAVDDKGRYHIFGKGRRDAETVHSAKHEAIKVGQANQISFKLRGANIVYYVNGSEVVQVPLANAQQNSRSTSGTKSVGLVAFGLGKYAFDDIQISHTN